MQLGRQQTNIIVFSIKVANLNSFFSLYKKFKREIAYFNDKIKQKREENLKVCYWLCNKYSIKTLEFPIPKHNIYYHRSTDNRCYCPQRKKSALSGKLTDDITHKCSQSAKQQRSRKQHFVVICFQE